MNGICYMLEFNLTFLISFNFQNFFQIVSNLLDEENKEKWEDAQQVRLLLLFSLKNYKLYE